MVNIDFDLVSAEVKKLKCNKHGEFADAIMEPTGLRIIACCRKLHNEAKECATRERLHQEMQALGLKD